MSDALRVAILGAGPIGLEAALAASEVGLDFTVFEMGDAVAANLRAWGHVRLFTPWSMNVSPRMRARLEQAGVHVPDDEACPTGAELVRRVLEPVANLPEIAPRLRTSCRVVQVGREGLLKSDEIGTGRRADRPFRLLVDRPDGGERVEHADIVLDCTGTYHHPNALGSGGIAAPGERAAADRIVRRIPDFDAERGDWEGLRILLVGAGHSAQTAARDLAALVTRAPATRVTWAIRSPAPTFGALENDALPERAGLVAAARRIGGAVDAGIEVCLGSTVDALRREGDAVRVVLRATDGRSHEVLADRIVALTGSVGDAGIYRQLQVHECWATLGPMKLAAALLASGSADCLDQPSTGLDALRSPEPDFYVLGAKSYGRNTTFLLRAGWEQVDRVIEALSAAALGAGDDR